MGGNAVDERTATARGFEPPPRQAPSPAIEVEGVNFAYGSGRARKQVLFDNTLSLRAGEFAVLTGPSGSGKTTLLTLIGALRALQEGTIRVLGTGLRGLSLGQMERMRRRVGFIFQDHNLFEALSAYDTVRLTMRLRPGRVTRRQLQQEPILLLTELGLEEQIHAKPKAMSTGQKQRVAIARALINHPKLILADEPTAALDRQRADQVVEILCRRVREEAVTILMVTHDPRIFEVADRVINMVDGRIVSETSPYRDLSELRERA